MILRGSMFTTCSNSGGHQSLQLDNKLDQLQKVVNLHLFEDSQSLGNKGNWTWINQASFRSEASPVRLYLL